MTSKPLLPAKDAREIILPETASGREKSGAAVPNSSMVDSTAAMFLTIAGTNYTRLVRGAFNALMAEVLDGHIRFHAMDPDVNPTSGKAKATQEPIDVLRTYLR